MNDVCINALCIVTESLVLFFTSFRWYPLTCKPGKNKSGYRGDIELSIGFSVNNHHEAKSEKRVSQVMSYNETQSSANISWSDNDNDDPGVVSEIEDEMLEEIGPVTPVLTPTHSTEDILDMFDETGERCYATRNIVLVILYFHASTLHISVWFVS